MRVDAKKNLKKVAGAVLKEPLATVREIADEAGVSKSTAHSMLDKVGQSIDRNKKVVEIEERDLEIVELGQKKTIEWAKTLADVKREDVNTLTQAMDKSQKRYSMLAGDVTDDKGGSKIPEEMKSAVDALLGRL